jgi:hypothetical protein
VPATPVPSLSVRAAMQSVYYHSIGRRFVSVSAPAVLLPGLDPMSLAEALQTLAAAHTWMRQAIWTIARAIAPLPLSSAADPRAGIERYPRALLDVLTTRERAQLAAFEQLRSGFCREAEILSSALVALAPLPDCWERFDAVRCAYFGGRWSDLGGGRHACCGARGSHLDTALRTALNLHPADDENAFTVTKYLEEELHRSSAPLECERELRGFEREIGMGLPDFMWQFADSVAFKRCFATEPPANVFPAASITVQDTGSLTTQVTVSALVSDLGFEDLRVAMDPQCWSDGSDAFRSTRFVEGPFDLRPLEPPPPLGDPGPPPRMLEEDVVLLWGRQDEEAGSCRNVLRMNRLDFDTAGARIDVGYDLCRSVSSRMLWDVRPGGLLNDSGYSLARDVCGVPGLWRVTSHKTVLWSDRLPYASGAGHDFGEALNYLSPALTCWWLESEMYGHGSSSSTATSQPD